MSDIVICSQPFHYDGIFYKRGTTVRVGHPLLEGGRDQYFQPLKVDYELKAAPVAAPKPVVTPEPARRPERPQQRGKSKE